MAAQTLQTSIEISGILSPSLQQSIARAVNELNKMSQETIDAASASQRLAAQIRTEESVLRNLEQGYADYVLQGQESSEEAQRLARQIQTLNGEVNGNRDRLQAACTAADQLTSGFDRTESEAGELDRELENVNNTAGQANEGFTIFKATLANLASQAITAAASAVKKFAGDVISLGQEFQATMSEVGALSGASAKDLERLEETARKYGATTVFSATEAGEALKYMSLAGWDTEQQIDALGGVLDLAASAGMGLGAASDMVTDYLSAFAMEASESAYFADMLAFAQANSNTSATQLGEAYRNCAANLNAAGQDVETVTSLLEGMANQGYKGSEAGTALAAMMRDITKKMKDGQIAIGETTIAVMDAEGNYRDLTDILSDVNSAVDGMGSAERAAALSTTFTADSTKGLNLLLNEGIGNVAAYEEALRMASVTVDGLDEELRKSGISLDDMKKAFEKAGISGESFDEILGSSKGSSEIFAEMLDEACEAGYRADDVFKQLGLTQDELSDAFANAKGSASLMAATMNDNLAGDLKSLGSAFDELKLKVYDKLEPLLRKGVQFVTDKVIPTVTNIKQYIPEITIAVSALSAVIAAFKWQSILSFASKVQGAFKGIVAALGTVSAPALVIIGVLTAVAAAFKHLYDTNSSFRLVIINTWAKIKDDFSRFGKEITERLNELGFSFTDITDVIKSVWEGFCEFLAPVLKGAFRIVEKVIGTTLDVLVNLFDTFSALFSGDWEGAWDGIKSIFSRVWQGISEAFSLQTEYLKKTADVFLGWFGTSWDEVWNAVPEPVKTAMSSVGEFVSDKFTSVKNFVANKAIPGITKAWNTVAPAVSRTASSAFRAASEKFGAIKDFVSGTAAPAIRSAVSDVYESVSENFGAAKDFTVNTMLPGIEKAFSDIQKTASEKFGAIKDYAADTVIPAIAEKWDEITSKVTEVINFVKPYITVAFEDVRAFIVDTVIPAVAEAITNIRSAVGPVIEFIRTDVIPKVQEFAGSVISVVQSAWKLIKAVFDKLRPYITFVFGAIVAVAVTAWQVIKAAFEPAVKVIGGAFKATWEVIKNVWNVASTYFTMIVNNISNVFSGVKALLEGDFSGAWEAVKNIFSGWNEFFGTLMASVKNIFGAAVSFIGTLFSGAWDFLVNLFEPVSSWITDNVLMPVSNKVSEVWNGITGFLSKTWTSISKTASALWGGITGFISKAWSTIRNVVQVGIMFIAELMGAAFDLITLPFRFIWENCKETLTAAWNYISETVSSAVESVQKFISEKFEAIKENISKVIETVKSFIENRFNAIKNVITTMTTAVKTTLSATWDSISKKVSSIWETIYTKVSAKINAVKSTVSAVINAVKDLMANVWSAISSKVSEIWNSIHKKISEKINAVKSTVETVISAVRDVMTSIWNSISSKVSEIWNSIHSKIAEKTSAVKETVFGKFREVYEAVKEKTELAYGKVSEVFGNIKDKIDNKVGDAKNAVSNAFRDIFDSIKSRCEDAFSKVSGIFENIRETIDSKINLARTAVETAIDKIKGVFNFSWNLPHLDLPHFKIDGEFSLNPPSVPSLGIDWYANGGIMTKPTAFGVNGNKLMVGGEAGPEAILPLEVLWNKLSQILSGTGNSIVNEISVAVPEFSAREREVIRISENSSEKSTASEISSVLSELRADKEIEKSTDSRNTVLSEISSVLSEIRNSSREYEKVTDSRNTVLSEIRSAFSKFTSEKEYRTTADTNAITNDISTVLSENEVIKKEFRSIANIQNTAAKEINTVLSRSDAVEKEFRTASDSKSTSVVTLASQLIEATREKFVQIMPGGRQNSEVNVILPEFTNTEKEYRAVSETIDNSSKSVQENVLRETLQSVREIISSSTKFIRESSLRETFQSISQTTRAGFSKTIENISKQMFTEQRETELSSENSIVREAGRLMSLDNFSLGELSNNSGTTIIYDFSNFQWKPEVSVDGKPDDSFMDQLKNHEYEFFDWLESFVKAREASYYV